MRHAHTTATLASAAALAFVVGQVDAAPVTSGLIGQYSFEAGDATNDLGTAAGNTNDGAANSGGSPAFVSDGSRSGTVLSTTPGNYIVVAPGNMPTNSEARTYAFWFRTTNRAGDSGPFRSGQAGSSGQDFSVELDPGAPNMTLNRWFDDMGFSLDNGANADATWQHVAVGYDGTNVFAYVNGSLKNSGARTLTTPDTGFALGGPRFNGPTNDASNFWIDDVLIYDRALTSTEIESLANADPIPEPGSLALLAIGGLCLGYHRRRA